MNNNSLISVDLAKNVFQICQFNEYGKPVFNKKISRKKLLETIQQLGPTRVVMEACYSSNHWGRSLQNLGFNVDLIPPHQVKPFVVGNKNDHNDAIAIAEAARRPKTKFVPVKSLFQQDIQSLTRIRERLLRSRTSLANQLRGLLAEYGVIVEKKMASLRKQVPTIIEDPNEPLTPLARQFVLDLYLELQCYDNQIAEKELVLKESLKQTDEYQRLQEIPGIGPVIASTTIAAVGNASQFTNGRQMSAWLGLTPKQIASGNDSRMVGISKRGNQALRKQFIHGARAIMRWSEGKDDKLSCWINALLAKKHPCKVAVAIANKMARIAWVVLAKNVRYDAAQIA